VTAGKLAAFGSWVALLAMLPALPCFGGADGGTPAAQSHFISRSGTRFMLDGRPFDVAGVNNHYLTFGLSAEVSRVLDDAVAMDANVVRTFIQPVIGTLDGTTVRTIWDWRKKAVSSDLDTHGVYMLYWDDKTSRMAINDGPDGLERLDYLISEARKRNLKLIIAFLDFWSYTGGAQQMRAWYQSSDERTFFARDWRTRNDYKTWVRHVLTRVNAIDGTPYAQDPTIFAWELMNEPDIKPLSLLRAWIEEMSTFIKSIDPHHLLTTGHANLYGSYSDLALPGIDFGTWHGYPIYFNVSPERMNEQIGEFCAIGRTFGKPMLLEEFGYARSKPRSVDIYRTWLDTLHNNKDCAGWLVWRLVSRQDNGIYPLDDHDQFDVHNDDGPLWQALKAAAQRLRGRAP
jgi:mannan endo-1,4-beta-mannosidase